MNWTIATYVAYLLVTIPLTIWVATTLSRNGRVFLADVFADAELATAVNTLLVVGFYLVNLGFVVLFLRSGTVDGVLGVFNTLSVKLGLVMLALGALHFLNLWGFSSARRRHRLDQQRAAAPLAAPYPPSPAPR